MNLNGGGSAAVGEPGAGVVLPQVAGGEVHLGDDGDAGDRDGELGLRCQDVANML